MGIQLLLDIPRGITNSKKTLKMFVRAIFVFLFIGVIFAEKCVDDSGCTCCDKHWEAYEDESCGKLCEDLAPEVCVLCPDFAEDVCTVVRSSEREPLDQTDSQSTRSL